jgi:hypothetical protein
MKMSTRFKFVFIFAIVICIWLAYLFLYKNLSFHQSITEKEAIVLLKAKYTLLKGYNIDNTLARSIKTLKVQDGWYVAFLDITDIKTVKTALCYKVNNNKTINFVNQYDQNSKVGYNEVIPEEFDITTCARIKITPTPKPTPDPRVCEVTNCHGLDITCGNTKPDACTAIYEIGDKCLQFATCGFYDNNCMQLQNPKFDQCKSCVDKCLNTYKITQDTDILFTCESYCGEK